MGQEAHQRGPVYRGCQWAGGGEHVLPQREVVVTEAGQILRETGSILLVDWPSNIDPTKHIAWLKKYWDTVVPHTDGFYTNDVVDESQKQIDENYLDNYPRLLALKNKYDPTNLLRLNANVVPKA